MQIPIFLFGRNHVGRKHILLVFKVHADLIFWVEPTDNVVGKLNINDGNIQSQQRKCVTYLRLSKCRNIKNTKVKPNPTFSSKNNDF